MKVIDKTALQNENGEIDVLSRIRGTLKYGLNWYSDLQAQKAVVAQLERVLEKGFILIRNFTLPNSEVVIPIILLGPGGVYVIHVTDVKGFFEAKGDQWNVVNNNRSTPASVNLMDRVAKYSRILQVYFNQQKIQNPAPIEPVLIAANPGAHIESMRPVARVVMSDAIKSFGSMLIQARSLWRTETIHDVADRIVNPQPPQAPEAQRPPTPAPTPAEREDPSSASSRARAIFNASETAKPFNPSELDFAFEENEATPNAPASVPQPLRETSPARPLPKPANKQGRILGMTRSQFALIAGMVVVELCVVVIGFIVIFLINR